MTVLVVHVWDMGMGVFQPVMPVPVRMRLPWWIIGPVLVAVMLVVQMGMRVGHWLMDMLVLVMLGQVQPDAETH